MGQVRTDHRTRPQNGPVVLVSVPVCSSDSHAERETLTRSARDGVWVLKGSGLEVAWN